MNKNFQRPEYENGGRHQNGRRKEDLSMSMLQDDSLQTQHAYHQHKGDNNTLGIRIVVAKSKTKDVEVTEESHEARTGDEIVGEKSHPSIDACVFYGVM